MNFHASVITNVGMKYINKIIIAFLFLLGVLASISILLSVEKPKFLIAQATDRLYAELISFRPPPLLAEVDAVYILGGSQKSLALKYKTVSELYHKNRCKRILILSRSGKTEYYLPLKRNLTNNEWSIITLKKFGVARSDIEIVKVNEEFFGTLSEAKCISELIKKRDYKSIILISSPYHTKRVSISFAKHLKDENSQFYVIGSQERVGLRELITEIIKLQIYIYCLI